MKTKLYYTIEKHTEEYKEVEEWDEYLDGTEYSDWEEFLVKKVGEQVIAENK